MKKIFAILLLLGLLLPGCGQEEEAWEKAPEAPASTETAAAFDPAQIDALLQGTWTYRDSAQGSNMEISFENGSAVFKSWLDAASDKVTVSPAAYSVEEGYVDLYFTATDYHNRMEYDWVGNVLVLCEYIDSGADAGNTRIYQKQASGTAAPPAAAADTLVGQWTAVGIVSKGSVVSFDSNAALADLYDTNWATFTETGYQIQNGVFTYEGTWQTLETEDVKHLYMLSQERYLRFTMNGDELEEVATESRKTLFAAYLDEECDVLLIYETLDDEETPLIYARDGEKTSFGTSGQGGTSAEPSQQTSKPSQSNGHTPTAGERNALESAKSYLRFMAFSYTGLIDQLEYEGYSYSEAKYAVDNCGADWYEQAVKCAESYLEYMSFSRSGLIEQLEYEGFTHDQAVYGVDQAY